MAKMITRLTLPLSGDETFDEIIDVRAPLEFAEDHISGAINLPVLNDQERAEVGTIYKQVSSFDARKIGAGLVSKNIAGHLESHFADKPKGYRPLIYCWRGGQRSGSMATILSEVGWAVSLIDGGYRAYRRQVSASIEALSPQLKTVVLNGYTGAGKTLVLKAIRELGGQVLDLEGLAQHKGSVFGGDLHAPQPAQKRFESLIYDTISGFDLSLPVYVEAESAKIGRMNLPNPLWQQMKQSTIFEIDSPLDARADYLTGDYEEWLNDPDRVTATIDRLTGYHANNKIAEWKGMVQSGEWRALIADLLAEHYDKCYHVSGDGNYAVPSESIPLARHDIDSVAVCAKSVMKSGQRLHA